MDQNNAGSATGFDLAALTRYRPNGLGTMNTESVPGQGYYLVKDVQAALARATPQHIPRNFATHRAAWRDALTFARDASMGDGAAYWQHELDAYDRSFARLLDSPEPVRPAATPQHSVAEQASIKTWQERYNEMGKGPSFNDKSVAMMAEIDDLRAALAIPASTAASEQQAGADERALEVAQETAYPYPGEVVDTGVKVRYTSESLAFRNGWRAALTHRATTAEEVHVSVNYPDCQHAAPVLRVVRTGGHLDILVEGRATTATNPCASGCQMNTTGDPQNDCGNCAIAAAPDTATTAGAPPCPHCDEYALNPSYKDGDVQHYQCGECLNPSHAATAADQQGDTARASGARKIMFAAYSRCIGDDQLTPDQIADVLLSAQQGAAQAQAGEVITCPECGALHAEIFMGDHMRIAHGKPWCAAMAAPATGSKA